MTSPRRRRTKLGTNTMAIAMAASLMSAPRRAATVKARISGGNEKRASIVRMITESTAPRKNPAISPRGMATTAARATISNDTRNEIRAPQIRRLRMSRPRSSVPSQCEAEGPALTALMSWASGACGATGGAKMAATITISRKPSPAMAQRWCRKRTQNPGRRSGSSSGLSPVSGMAVKPTKGSLAFGVLHVLIGQSSRQPDLRVQVGVDDVDDQVDEDEGEGHHQHHPLDLGDVLVADGLDDVGAEPGQREDLLDDEGAPEEVPELDADDGHGRAQGVLQGVLPDHHPGAQALGHRGPHVVLVQGVDEGAADLARDHGGPADAERQPRQQQVLEPF